jgi:two-component system OmpR family response regulator/two-component system response regulator QseB
MSRPCRPVVVCDADPAATAAHAAALAGAGFAVTVCDSVGACVRAVRRVRAAAVVLGLLFPDGDGLELLVRLAAEVRPRPRLIMVSAVRAADWAGPVGADAFLPKPVSGRRLIGTVRALLQEDA